MRRPRRGVRQPPPAPVRLTTVRILVALLLGALLAACASPVPTPSPSTAPTGSPAPSQLAVIPVERRAGDGAFVLTVTTPSLTWQAGQEIGFESSLTYLGPGATIEVIGSGSGLVGFTLEQLDGPLDVGGAWTADCVPYELARGKPLTSGYEKSGGWSDTDPNADVFQAFITDPVFRLPAGEYVVRTTFEGYLGGCGGERHSLTVELPLTILP